LGGIGLLGIIGGGGWLYLQLQDDPTKNAEKFVEHVGNGEFSEANSLIHADARIESAGAVADFLSAWAGVNAILELAEISVAGSEVVNRDGNRARVSVTVDVDLQVEQRQTAVDLMMEKDDKWFVWDLGQ
jgi:hypothetical protein